MSATHSTIKKKAHLASSTLNALVWAPEGMNVARVRDAMDESQIANLVRRLDSDGVPGTT